MTSAICPVTFTTSFHLSAKCPTNRRYGQYFQLPIRNFCPVIIELHLYFRYCPRCKTESSKIVKAGEKLKESEKKAKASSILNKEPDHDWGRDGSKECKIIPSNRFGLIPGVDVGTTWRFRFQIIKLSARLRRLRRWRPFLQKSMWRANPINSKTNESTTTNQFYSIFRE